MYQFIKKEILLLFLLLVFFIDPYQKGYYVCFILALYFISIEFFSLWASLDKLGVSLFLFSVSYAVIYSLNPEDSIPYIIVLAIAPLTFYNVGKYFSTKYHSRKIFYYLIMYIAIGYSLIPIISILYSIMSNGFVGERGVRLLTRQELSGGPLLGSFFTINIAMIGTVFVQTSRKIENTLKYIIIAMFFVSLLCVLRVASRTQLGIALLSLIVTICYAVFKQPIIKNIQLIVSMLVLSVVLMLTYSPNAAYLNILNERNNDQERIKNVSGRTELWDEALNNIATKPFGWEMQSDVSDYAHNLWLDVDRVAGIIPFTFLLIFTVFCIFLVLKTIKISPHDLYFNTMILVIFIGLMAVFFVEPIIEGMFYLFLIFCLFIGILSGYVKTGLVYKKRLRLFFSTILK